MSAGGGAQNFVARLFLRAENMPYLLKVTVVTMPGSSSVDWAALEAALNAALRHVPPLHTNAPLRRHAGPATALGIVPQAYLVHG